MMEASKTQSGHAVDVQSSSQQSEEDLVEGLIFDYACKNYMQPVISGMYEAHPDMGTILLPESR